MTQEHILEIHNTQTRGDLFASMYEQTFPGVARFVAQHGGGLEDAKDIFQDALVIYYEMIAEKKTIVISDHAYLTGIAKHVWIKKYKKDKHVVVLDNLESTIEIPADYFEPHDNRLLRILEHTGQRCMELIRAFYYDKLSLTAISNAFGFSGIRSATVQKYKCIEKMREIVKQNSINYEDLAE